MADCWIFGSLQINETNLNIPSEDFVIAADSGLETLKAFGIKPDLIVGDFDSLGYKPEGENVVLHPIEKDDTDTLLSVKKGLEKGYRSFHILGCIGGRLDHTFASIQTAAFIAENGGIAILYDGNNRITVIKNRRITFTKENKGIISVFAVSGEAEGVTEKGLHYELENTTLSPDFPLGVSNEFVGEDAYIEVKNGKLCIIWDASQGSFKFD